MINVDRKEVGHYILDTGSSGEWSSRFVISCYVKIPSFIKRFFMKHLLGFEFEPVEVKDE